MYFDYRDQDDQSATSVVASILKQIVAAFPTVPSSVMEIFDKLQGSEHQLSLHELEEIIHSVTASTSCTYLVIDALDECDEQKHRRSLLKILERFKGKQHIRVFVTSRSYPQDIRTTLGHSPQIVIEAHDSDLRLYMLLELQNACEGIIDEEFALQIVEKIIKGAQGLWVLQDRGFEPTNDCSHKLTEPGSCLQYSSCVQS